MVVASTPEAARAGAEVLAAGGNAVDAAVAVGFALGASDMASAGLGGQAYLLVRMADGRAAAIDGSVQAPLRASRQELQQLRDADQAYGHRMVAAPGMLAALVHALERYGTKPLPSVMAPAIAIAESGSRHTLTQRGFIDAYLQRILAFDSLRTLILRDGVDLWAPEHVFCYPDLAATMRRIAALGPREFYVGGIAARIEADMEANGGYLRRSDLAQVRPVERTPLRITYRGHEVLGFPLPGAGGTLLAALAMLEHFPAELVAGDSLDRLQLLVEVVRIAMIDAADRRLPPTLLELQQVSPQHARERVGLIRFDRALFDDEIGEATQRGWFERDTTHFSVADRFGNVVAATLSLGRGWGACVATPGLGFPYNALLESFEYQDAGSPGFLRPGARPRTTKAPTVVLRDGRPRLLVGSAGSTRIPSSTLAPIVNVIDAGMPLGAAVARPRVLWSGNELRKVYIEIAGEITAERADALAARGYPIMYRQTFPGDIVKLRDFGSVNAVLVDHERGVFVGVGDPRRQGTAVGVPPDPPR
jgi:gamma-glutamyltranspeptidase/glutathione hydrolase